MVASFGPQITYAPKANSGKSSALNLGLQLASREYIYVLDDDDVATKDAIERLATALRSSPECGFAYAGHDAFRVSASGEVLTEARETHPPEDDSFHLTLMRRCLLFQSNLLVRKSCYEHVGPFNEAFIRSQDYEMLLRLVREFRGRRVDGIVFHQRQHSGVRGSAALRIKEENTSAVWYSFNQKIFETIYAKYALREFLPRDQTVLSDQDQISALCERCVIVGRRGLWKLAAQDLREIGAIAKRSQIHGLTPKQSLILQRMFDASSSSLHDFAGAVEFRAALKDIPDPKLSKQIRAALGVPFAAHIRRSIERREFKAAAYFLACFMCFASVGGSVIRYFGDFALRLLDRRQSAKASPGVIIPSASS